ncbi:uncharacterized protein C8Q71DRAFT_861944 [Rhodofomes roseus]|uniref:SAP domain-containing protein n=1 Tax=Rhodofomes roseus TaxID=34475 RepID=A0A4Y9XXP5_9APHY|nr:uncharacterized protein C8Q71DRAFT_861944 [Rhodofomes roseus]KAH9831211.1 hypothetical protein C8Q71DRAFT_861944 [Rhodofomes roseus]TFY53921.1 hypothetical protein EVJ58_g9168 [Rhodofomes roseus]
MDAKLKALKVVDLKDILTRAGVSVPSKSNKNDLIARVLASPAALDVYNAQHSPKAPVATSEKLTEQQPQPTRDEPPSEPPSQPTPPAATPNSPARAPVKPTSSAAQVTPDTPSTETAATPNASKSAEDDELERRKARAARFGLPLVEPSKTPPESKKVVKNANTKIAGAPLNDPDKLAARAARFGTAQPAATQTTTSQSNGRKRNAPPVEAADEEELEKRRKRAERFGMPVVGAKA